MSKVIFEYISPEENSKIKACFNSEELYRIVLKIKNSLLNRLEEAEKEKREEEVETLREIYKELGELIIEEKVTDLF